MGNDLRSALRSAMDSGKVSAPTSTSTDTAAAVPTPAASAAPSSSPTAPTSPARDEGGRFSGKGEAAPPVVAGEGSTATSPGKGVEADPSTASTPKPTAPAIKAPASWTVKAREKWSALDPEIQAEIDRVERAATQRIQKAAAAEKFHASLSPYESVLAELGGGDKGIASLLAREAAFRKASPAEKARIVGDMVMQGQIPVDALDGYLAEKMRAAPAPLDPEAIISQAEQRIAAKFQNYQRAQAMQSAQSKIAEFQANHEFADVVSGTMAGLIEGGIASNLDEAYNMAISLPKHSDIKEVLEQRKAAEAAKRASESVERSKAAAMSVRSSPVATAAPVGNSLREQLAANLAASRR